MVLHLLTGLPDETDTAVLTRIFGNEYRLEFSRIEQCAVILKSDIQFPVDYEQAYIDDAVLLRSETVLGDITCELLDTQTRYKRFVKYAIKEAVKRRPL